MDDAVKWLVLGLMVFLAGCMQLTDSSGRNIELKHTGVGLEGRVDVPLMLQATLKGSIYESGEVISLYGACLDAQDDGAPNSYALLSSWYPNGTVQLTNVSMTQLQTGFFLYSAPMSAVQGTYLTQVDCYVTNTSLHARAFGEWQNPFWVSQINATNVVVGTLPDALQNLNQSLLSLNNSLTLFLNGTNITVNFSDEDQLNTSRILDIVNEELTCGGVPTVIITFNNSNITFPCTGLGERLHGMNESMSSNFLFIDGQLLNITQILQNASLNVNLSNVTNQLLALNDLVLNVSVQLNSTNASLVSQLIGINQSIVQAILDANVSTYAGFNITWSLLREINDSLTLRIQAISVSANASVDRNDSYLAKLLRGVAVATGAPVTGFLNTTVVKETPTYFKTWRVEAQVINEYGEVAGPPLVNCFVTTNNNPSTVNQSMEYDSTQGAKVLPPSTKNFFFWEESVQVLGNFSSSVVCRYNAVIG